MSTSTTTPPAPPSATPPSATRRAWRRRWWVWAAMGVAVVVLVALGADRRPATGTSAARLDAIAADLRCLQCTGESVAGSQAPIALKMRDEILRQARQGATDDEIFTYFVDRYGPRVLLNPPATGIAGLVWVLPVLVIVAAAAGVGSVLARWRAVGRAVALGEGAGAAPVTKGASLGDGRARPSWRPVVVVGSVVVFGVAAGVLVANNAGQRSQGESLTGSGADAVDPAADCRSMAMAKPAEAIDCYGEVLAEQPDDPESLTYRGWARYRTDDRTGATADFDRVVAVAPEYPDVYVFRAVAAKDEGRFVDAQAELDRLRSLDPPAQLLDTMSSMGLEVTIAEGLLAPDTAACWTQERTAIDAVNTAVAASMAAGEGADDGAPTTTMAPGAVTDALTELVAADRCLASVLVVRPDDVDALVMRGLAISILYQVSLAAEPDAAVLGRALDVLSRAVALAPEDPDPRLIRAAVANMAGDPRAAKADLDAMGERSPSPLYGSIDAAAIRADVDRQLAGG